MKATKNAVEKLQKIYGVLGTYGGTVIATEPGDFQPVMLEIGSITDNTAKAMIGAYQLKGKKKKFGFKFYLEIKFRDGRITTAEIKRFSVSKPWELEVEEDGFETNQGRPTGRVGRLKEAFSHFMLRTEAIPLFVQRNLATVTKYENPADDKMVVPSIIPIVERGSEKSDGLR